jgi:hypothetical protein
MKRFYKSHPGFIKKTREGERYEKKQFSCGFVALCSGFPFRGL